MQQQKGNASTGSRSRRNIQEELGFDADKVFLIQERDTRLPY